MTRNKTMFSKRGKGQGECSLCGKFGIMYGYVEKIKVMRFTRNIIRPYVYTSWCCYKCIKKVITVPQINKLIELGLLLEETKRGKKSK